MGRKTAQRTKGKLRPASSSGASVGHALRKAAPAPTTLSLSSFRRSAAPPDPNAPVATIASDTATPQDLAEHAANNHIGDSGPPRLNSAVSTSAASDSTPLVTNLTDLFPLATLATPEPLYVPLQRLAKRSCSTRIRACEDLEALLETNGDLAFSLLPHWPRLFRRLATEENRQLRVACFSLHAKLVPLVGRKLGPHLRELFNVWFMAFDDVPAVSRLATSSYNNVFPENKRATALIHFLPGLLAELEVLICSSTPESLGDARYQTRETMLERYSFLVSMAILTTARLALPEYRDSCPSIPFLARPEVSQHAGSLHIDIRVAIGTLFASVLQTVETSVIAAIAEQVSKHIWTETTDSVAAIWWPSYLRWITTPGSGCLESPENEPAAAAARIAKFLPLATKMPHIAYPALTVYLSKLPSKPPLRGILRTLRKCAEISPILNSAAASCFWSFARDIILLLLSSSKTENHILTNNDLNQNNKEIGVDVFDAMVQSYLCGKGDWAHCFSSVAPEFIEIIVKGLPRLPVGASLKSALRCTFSPQLIPERVIAFLDAVKEENIAVDCARSNFADSICEIFAQCRTSVEPINDDDNRAQNCHNAIILICAMRDAKLLINDFYVNSADIVKVAPHCVDCCRTCARLICPNDEEAVAALISLRADKDSLSEIMLAMPCFKSEALTDAIICCADSFDEEEMSEIISTGKVNEKRLIRDYIANGREFIAGFFQSYDTDDIEIAKWLLRYISRDDWAFITIPSLDLNQLVSEFLLDETITTERFTELADLTKTGVDYIVERQNILQIFSSATINSVELNFLDYLRNGPCLLPASSMQFVLEKVVRLLSLYGYPTSWTSADSWRLWGLITAAGGAAPLPDPDAGVTIETVWEIFESDFEGEEDDTEATTAQILSYYHIASECSTLCLSPGWCEMFITFGARVCAAALAGSKGEVLPSQCLDFHCVAWLTKLLATRHPKYLMLINVARFAVTDDYVIADIFDEMLVHSELRVNAHLLLLLMRYKESKLASQYSWLILEGLTEHVSQLRDKSGDSETICSEEYLAMSTIIVSQIVDLFSYILSSSVTFDDPNVESTGLEPPTDIHNLREKCVSLFLENTVPCEKLSRFMAIELSYSNFDTAQLYELMSTAEQLHVIFASYIILSRQVSIVANSLALSLEIAEYDDIDSSLQLPKKLLDLLELKVSENEDTNSESGIKRGELNLISHHAERESRRRSEWRWLLAWKLVLLYFTSSNLQLRLFWVNSVPFEKVLDVLVPRVAETPETIYSMWDVSSFCPTMDSLAAAASPEDGKQLLAIACCNLMYEALSLLPTSFRRWWATYRDKGVRKTVERLVQSYYSPKILDKEVIQTSRFKKMTPGALPKLDTDAPGDNDENFKVSCSRRCYGGWDGLTIKATYTVDDSQIEVHIAYPHMYPLVPAMATSGERVVAVSEHKLRTWLLSCERVLRLPNTTAYDALKLLKNDISHHLQGVSECAICFAVVGTSCRSLPNRPCRTCKNVFHGSCLYRWVKTSSNAVCPLCRTML